MIFGTQDGSSSSSSSSSPSPVYSTFRRVDQDVTLLSECDVTCRTAPYYIGAGAHYVAT